MTQLPVSPIDAIPDLRELDLMTQFGRDLDPWFGTHYIADGFNQNKRFFRRNIKRFGFDELGRVLDMGCAYGRWSIFLAEQNPHAVGIDANQAAITVARRLAAHLEIENVEFTVSSVEHTPFPTDDFDGVWIHSVFSFVPRSKLLWETARVLKPGGKLFMGGCNGPGRVLQKLVAGYRQGGTDDGQYRKARTALEKGPDYNGPPSYVTRPALVKLLDRYGFSVTPEDTFEDFAKEPLPADDASIFDEPATIPARFESDDAFRDYVIEHHRRLMVGVPYDFWFTATLTDPEAARKLTLRR